jgi:hypothetical protein
LDEEKEGKYCAVCGGVVPDRIRIRRITVEGKEIGLDQLDLVLDQVDALHLLSEGQIKEELLRRIATFNYIPTRKREAYGTALLDEYRKRPGNRKDSG